MKYLLIPISLFVTNFAHAGFFIEPFIGYKSETIKLTDFLNSVTEIKTAEPSYGVKLGYRSLVGIDLNLAGEISTGQASVSSQIEKSKFSHTNASIQLGVNALGLIKMYLGSSFLNEFNLEDSSSLQGYKLSGPAFHAGLQLKFFPLISLGLQYNLNQYNSIVGANYIGDSKIETYYSKNDTQDYSIYLSTSF